MAALAGCKEHGIWLPETACSDCQAHYETYNLRAELAAEKEARSRVEKNIGIAIANHEEMLRIKRETSTRYGIAIRELAAEKAAHEATKKNAEGMRQAMKTVSHEYAAKASRCDSCGNEVRSLCRGCSGLSAIKKERDEALATVGEVNTQMSRVGWFLQQIMSRAHSVGWMTDEATRLHDNLPESARKYLAKVEGMEKVVEAARDYFAVRNPRITNGEFKENLEAALAALDALKGNK